MYEKVKEVNETNRRRGDKTVAIQINMDGCFSISRKFQIDGKSKWKILKKKIKEKFRKLIILKVEVRKAINFLRHGKVL